MEKQDNKRRQLIIGLPFFCACLAAAGCATFTPEGAIRALMGPAQPHEYSLIKVDLDRDGQQEYIVVAYATGQSGRVRVIRFRGKEATVIFDRTSKTPNVSFTMRNNIPRLRFEELTCVPDCATGGQYTVSYEWGGKTFVIKEKSAVYFPSREP